MVGLNVEGEIRFQMGKTKNSKRTRITVFMIIGSVLLAVIGAFTIAVPLLGYGHMSAVTTDSMETAVPKGSLLFTVASSPSQVKKGDIITISSQNNADITVSRVEDMKPSQEGVYAYTLKADNSFTPDPWLHKTNGTMEKVVTIIPFLGWVFLALSHPLGAFFVVALMLTVSYLYTMRLYEYNRRKVKARQEAMRRLELMSYGDVDDIIELFGEENITVLNDTDRKNEKEVVTNEA